MTFGVSPKVTLKVTPKVTFWPEKSLLSHIFRVKKSLWELLLGLLWGRPRKSLFSHFLSYFEFFGVRGVLAGFQDLNPIRVENRRAI